MSRGGQCRLGSSLPESATPVTHSAAEWEAPVRLPARRRLAAASALLLEVPHREAQRHRTLRRSCLRGSHLHTPGIARLHSWRRWIASFAHKLSDQTTRRARLGSRAPLKRGAKTFTPKCAGRRWSDFVLGYRPHAHQSAVHVGDRRPLDWFRGEHCINEVGKLGGNLTARNAQRFAVPYSHRRLMIFSRVEGRW